MRTPFWNNKGEKASSFAHGIHNPRQRGMILMEMTQFAPPHVYSPRSRIIGCGAEKCT